MNLPIEFEKKMKVFLGEEWEDFLYSYDNNRFQALRFNTLKIKDKTQMAHILEKLGISPDKKVTWANEAYYYDEDKRPGKHPYHEMGLYYIQEPSAMSAAALLAPEQGMRVLDLCAAPGGKSTQLSTYLGDDGLLVLFEADHQHDVAAVAVLAAALRGEAVLAAEDCRLRRLAGLRGSGLDRLGGEAVHVRKHRGADPADDRQAQDKSE